MGLPRKNNSRPTTRRTSNPAHGPAMNPFSMDDDAEDDGLISDEEVYDGYGQEEPSTDMVEPINDEQSFDDDEEQAAYLDEEPNDYDLDASGQAMQEPMQSRFPHRKTARRKNSEFKPPETVQNVTTGDIRPVGNPSPRGTSTATLIGLAASMASFVLFVPMLGLMLSILQGSRTPLTVSGIVLIVLPFVGLAAGAMALSHKGEHKSVAIASIVMSIVSIVTIGTMAMQMGSIQAKVIDSVNSTFTKVMESSVGSSLPSPDDSGSKYGDDSYGGSNDSGRNSRSSDSKSNSSKSSGNSKTSESSGSDYGSSGDSSTRS